MGGTNLFFLFINIYLFTFIFWILIFLTRYFFFKSDNISKNIFYECGFKAYETLELKLTTSFLIISIIFILYDIEFILLIALFINISNYSLFLILFILIILSSIIIVLVIDNIFFFIYWPN